MSHLLHVWESPRPATLAEAIAIRDRLLREKAPPSPRCRELAARLTARFPDIDTSGDAEEDDVWTDGPLAGNADASVFGIGVLTHAADRVAPFIIETALQLGLVVLDEESALVHVPGAARHPPPPPAPAATAGSLQTKKLVQALCLQSLDHVMSVAGFKIIQRQGTMTRKMSQATARVGLDVTDYGSRFSINFGLSILPVWPEPWSALAQAHGTDACLVDLAALARSAGIEKPGTPGSCVGVTTVSNEAELRALLDRWSVMMTHAFLPLCNRCEDLQGLEREFNMEDSVFLPMPVGLMLAAAVGREGLDDLAQLYAQRVPNWFKVKLANLCSALTERGLLR